MFQQQPKVYTIIPVYNRWNETKRSLDSLCNSDYPNLHIVVADSGSTDETSIEVKRYAVMHIRISEQLWWAGAMNIGIAHAMKNGADYVLVYDSGVTVPPDTISSLVEVATNYSGTVLAAALFDENTKKPRWVGKRLHWMFPLYRYNLRDRRIQVKTDGNWKLVPTDTVFGRVALINCRYFEQVGLFRENVFPHYHADVDWALRAKKMGFQQYVLLEAQAFEFHRPQVSTRLFQKNTYFSRNSDVNFIDTWNFIKYCCPYKNVSIILFISFYIEFVFRRVKSVGTALAKRVLSKNAISRIADYRINKSVRDLVVD